MPKKKTGHYNICPICKVEFYVEKHREVTGRGVYCSKTCFYKREIHNQRKGKSFPHLQREGAPNFQGGKILRHGYIHILCREHPNKYTNNYVPEHHLIMEKAIGRYLDLNQSECVHHINGIKTDNRLENLMLMTRREHDKLHAPTKRFWEKSPLWIKGQK